MRVTRWHVVLIALLVIAGSAGLYAAYRYVHTSNLDIPFFSTNVSRSRAALSIPLVNKNSEALNQISYGLKQGWYKRLERCDRDCTDVMMRRARIVNAVFKEVCSQERLNDAIKLSAGHQYNYTVHASVNGKKWDYFTQNRVPATGGEIDYVDNIHLARAPDNRLPEGIGSVRFAAHKVDHADAGRDIYSAEIYASDMDGMEVERAAFNENGEMVVYLRFKRAVDQYILLLDNMTIQDMLCVTYEQPSLPWLWSNKCDR